MKAVFVLLLLGTGLATHSVTAQTKTTTKPATKASTTTKTAPTRTTTRPTAKPVAKPATQPAAKPAAPESTSPPASTPTKFEIPGVAAQQAPSFAKGTIGVNLGLGLGIGYGYGYNGLGGSTQSSPAVSLSVEKGIVEGIGPGVISVGGLVGYKSESYKWNTLGDDYKSSWNNIYIAARGAYHYNFTDNPKIDTYAGVSLAARIMRYSTTYTDTSLGDYSNSTSLDAGIFLGGRYLVTDKLGAFAELGYDMSYLKIGLTSKF